MTFIEKLNRRIDGVNSLVCVGLDQADLAFNLSIIQQTHKYVCAFKPNLAFYEALGLKGWQALKQTMDYLREKHPEIVTIADAKRGDIGSTNTQYAKAIFDELGFDAVTLHPYLGQEALEPFLAREDKGCLILCRTSNPGAGELQDLKVEGKPLWQIVAERVAGEWNRNGNCGLVVGATYPEELAKVRQIVGEMPLLVPGVGVQGGEIKATVLAGKDSKGRGMIINSSRGIMSARDPRREAKRLRDEINCEILNI